MVNVVTETNVNPGGRTQIISPATAGITATAVEQVARGRIFDGEGRRRMTRKSKKSQRIMTRATLTRNIWKGLYTSMQIT